MKTYFSLMLVLETMMIGVFAATDVFLFYVFFEAMLIPMYFMIGSYGAGRRQYAAVKFLLYSLLGGLLMLVAVIALYVYSARSAVTGHHGTFLFNVLIHVPLSPAVQKWLFLGFFIAFAIKAPLWPFHTWLPDAAAAAPPGAAVLLVGVLDKVGTFGMLRYCLELFPSGARYFTPLVIMLAVIGILYGAHRGHRPGRHEAADRLHLGLALRLHRARHLRDDQPGRVRRDVLHGQPRVLHRRAVPRGRVPDRPARLAPDRRLRRRAEGRPGAGRAVPDRRPGRACRCRACPPSSASSWCWSAPSPGTRWPPCSRRAGIVLAAIYILWMYQRTMTGPVRDEVQGMPDLRPRELLAVAPLIVLLIVLGVYPKPVLDIINPAVRVTMTQVHTTDPRPAHPGRRSDHDRVTTRQCRRECAP